MTFWRRLPYLLPWRRRAAERDMQEELRALAELAGPGELGNLTLAAEDARAEWGWVAVEQFGRDVRYGVRGLIRNPGFAATALLSLGLGIGANTALFSLWHGVLHAPLPAVARPTGLVMLTDPTMSGSWTGRWTGREDGPRAWVTNQEFEALRDRADAFATLMASQSSLWDWTVRVDDGAPEEVRGRLVSGTYFEVLGVSAAAGRVFTAAEDRADAAIAVISDRYRQRRFGDRADVLGRTMVFRGVAVTIVGVTPAGFIGETSGQQPDVWLPLRLAPALVPGRDRLRDTPPTKVMWLHVFGRLKPGATLAQAEAQANAILQSELEAFYGPLAGDRRTEFLDQRLRLQSGARGASPLRSELSGSLTALLAGVGVLLLVACANLANLLLARGTARSAEMALRLSLGASRGRLVRQLVTECLVVAVLGGVAALAVAALLFGVLVQMVAVTDARFHLDFALDPAVLAFTPAATMAALLLFGVFPAWQVTRPTASTNAALKSHTRGAIGSRGQQRTGRWLVSAQLALSLPLLCGAALLGRTAYNLQHADLGFEASDLALVRVNLRDAAPDVARREALRRALVDRLHATPGVRAVSYSHLGLFTGGESSSSIRVEGAAQLARPDHSAMDYVAPSYFTTLGVRLRQGRDILDGDREGSMPVCVINEAFAKRFFAGRDPIGQRITDVEDGQTPVEYRVVGVAADARTQALRGDVDPRFFVPIAQRQDAATAPIFLIRTAGPPEQSLTALRATIRDVDPAVEIMFAKSAAAQLEPVTAQDRTTAILAVAFGGVALALSALGLYGVLAYGVARRGTELAVRIALGALPDDVVRMILRETAGLFAAGLLAGGGLAWLASRSIGSLLYGVAPHDPVTLLAATALLLVVALAAAFVPARRASRLDPTTALRQ